jgi:hypothetical protein
MLSSQFENLILEYKQDITVKKMGEPLVARFAKDVIQNPQQLAPETKKIVDALSKTEEALIHAPNPEGATPEDLAKIEAKKEKLKEKSFILKNQLAVKILGKLEDADPTPNKNYVQWLARTYINNDDSLEDVESTTADYLDKFHRLKIKHHLDNNDIGQYKDFDTFMNDMDKYPNDLIDDDQGKKKKYNADIIYDEKGILIVRPNDKEASCRYGRGTRWCTAATRGHNYFASYTSRGPLYMFMPRKPNHPGEKYQFHFEDGVVADETDSYLSQNELIKLTSDYPALKDAFKEQAEKHGLIWLQKPKRVHKGSNFNVEEYRKNDKPYYLMKPTDQVDQIYGMENTEYGMKVFDLSDRNSYRGSNELNTIQEHDLFNNYPELVTKFGVKGANIVSDPTVTDTKNKAKIEQHGNIVVMTDQHGHKTSIIIATDSSTYDETPIEIEALRTSPFKDKDKKGEGADILDKKRYHTLNPYELTLEHPELVEVFGTRIQKHIKDANKNLSSDLSAKQKREHMEKSLRNVAAYLPYKLYDKGNIKIKSHMTSDGKPVRDYITNTEDNTATIINRDIRTGEVDSIQPANIERLNRISRNDSHTLHNRQGELYGDAEMQPELQRLYSSPDDREDQALDFLPSISFLEQNPELKDFYKNTSLLEPKVKDYPTNVIKDYGKVKVPDGKRNRGYYNSIVKEVESMRNYIVKPKDAKDGESYAISWSPEQPMYVEVYHSDATGRQTQLDTSDEVQHVLKKFPELRNLHEKDYINFIDGTDREPAVYSPYGGNDIKRNGMPEHLFNPSEEVINDRVEILQYGPNPTQTHELPKFEVKPKEKNPFGELGDTFFVHLSLKDNRGKYGKISEITIRRLGNNLYKPEPVDQYGNYENKESGVQSEKPEFVAVDTKIRKQTDELSSKEVVDFFRYYPELRRMIKDENIHPKVPPPALATKPDETGNVETNTVQMDNFKLEDAPSTSPGVEKQYIIPDQPEYEGEFYTLFTYDPHTEPAFKNGQTVFTEYGRMKVLNDRGFTQLVNGEVEKGRSYYNRSETTQEEMHTAWQGRSSGTMTPNTPAYNRLMQRLPDLKTLISEKSTDLGDYRTQNLSEDDVVELGTERVYTFKNRDGSDLYIITPVGNPLRGEHGEIKQSHSDENHNRDRLGNDVGYSVRKLASDETDWTDEDNLWNENAFAINFESTENNPYLSVELLLDPFASIIDLQLMDTDLDDSSISDVKKQFDVINKSNMPEGGVDTYLSGTYLGKAKKNPELYRWLKEKAETRNAETGGIGEFINFLDVTSEQMTDEQRSVPKVYGIDIVGIAKIGISNPIYMWQGRKSGFDNTEYTFEKAKGNNPNRYGSRNIEYKNSLKDIGINVEKDNTWVRMMDSTILIKPESDSKFMALGSRGYGSSGDTGRFVQIPNAKFLGMAPKLPNSDKIISKKNLKAMGAIPTQTWGPRQVAALAPSTKLTNNGKPWIKSIKEFKMPDGIGIESHGYGADLPSKVLPPGTGYMITLNPISNDDGPKKRVNGKLVRQRNPWSSMMSVFRDKGLDLPWEFTHEVLDYGAKENKLLIYFANNRVAYLINPNSNSFTKYNLKQDEKKALFFDEEYGLFPQLKPIFDEYTKSNKWLRENQIHAIMSKIIFEGLGDKAYYELQKKKSKPNYGQLVFLNNIRLTGSYSNEQLKAMGFFMKNGSWAIQKPKYDRLVGDGKLKEMINRPLITGKNKIPNVGRKKVNEGTWSFDEEGILELLKKPLLRGGDNADVDLSCEVCQGHGCGPGYDIKDDLERWTKMLDPEADSKPDHLTNQYIEAKIKQLEAMVKKFPNGIPDNIDCSAGMSNIKQREYEKIKRHDAEDVLYSVFGDDSLFDDMSELDEDDDVRPLIMARLKELDPTLHEKALSIYKDRSHLSVVKEGKKLPRTSEFLYQKVDEVEDIKRLSGVYDNYQIPVYVEGATSAYSGSNISKTAAEIAKIMKEKNIQPGTPEWFQLWFSLPKMTGEKPTGKD